MIELIFKFAFKLFMVAVFLIFIISLIAHFFQFPWAIKIAEKTKKFQEMIVRLMFYMVAAFFIGVAIFALYLFLTIF